MYSRKIYIARHGERIDFVDPTWYGNAKNCHDPHLTKRGQEQASDLGEKLKPLNITHIYASPFSRCANTAANAAGKIDPNMKICIEPGACEWLNPNWYLHVPTGPKWRSVADLKAEFPCIDDTYESIFPINLNSQAFPESEEQLRERCMKMIKTILQTCNGDGNVLIVGHGSSVEALFMGLVPGLGSRNIGCKFLRE